jgi:hypothetical protein
MGRLTRLAAGAMAFATLIAGGVTTALPAGAYGNDGHLDVYQIGISFNCNNKAFCESQGLGGFWGWAELDHNPATGANTGDAEFAFCAHGTFNGAGHDSQNITNWYIKDGTFYGSGTDTTTFRGQTQVTPFTDMDFGVPAVPGHYNTADVFGITPPPGVSAQIQVAYKPAH